MSIFTILNRIPAVKRCPEMPPPCSETLPTPSTSTPLTANPTYKISTSIPMTPPISNAGNSSRSIRISSMH